ncbi:MAG: hypothetical protein QG652_412 [Pseudomonadota bacterium]|nr:hypothetical protein [Pseudomonadota bacterium]
MMKLDLPQPDASAVEHSAQLAALIRNTIAANSGWIDFSQYMQLALYAPGLGYYSAGLQKFGEQGDFMTAPEISSLFAFSLANPVAKLLAEMSQPHVIEFGAGSGRLAADLLLRLEALNILPEKYLIIELSAELQQRQLQMISQQAPHLLHRVIWLQQLPLQPLNGIVLANEVLDAMPVSRFVKQGDKFFPLGVALHENDFVLRSGPFEPVLHQTLQAIEEETGVVMSHGYTSEINLHVQPWLQAVSDMLNQGVAYLIDYGYPRAEYYSAERSMGTLMCHCRHRSFDDAMRFPGLQDITAFVDFTAVAEAAAQAGFDVQGFASQGNFLLDCGLPALLQEKTGTDERRNLQWIQQMKTLTLPSEMGERFKVLGLSKNINITMPGFGMQDLRYRL